MDVILPVCTIPLCTLNNEPLISLSIIFDFSGVQDVQVLHNPPPGLLHPHITQVKDVPGVFNSEDSRWTLHPLLSRFLASSRPITI